MEFKQTSGWAVTLRPEQVGWIARRVRHGGRVYIAVRQRAPAGPRRDARDVLWLLAGRHAARAKAEGLRGPWFTGAVVDGSALQWHGGPTRWDWDAVAAALVA